MSAFMLAVLKLMRADRPVGTVLLALPMLWALWLASNGRPQPHVVLIFLAGAFIMRSAGCVINDFADRDIDHQVKRTQNRVLTSGHISAKAALAVFACLLVCALLLLCFLPSSTFLPALIAFVLATLYPFTKRFFIIPQLILGLAFSMAIVMAFTAITADMPVSAWWLFAAATVWTVIYDTFYAMVDRDDDVALGIHSSALWFGKLDIAVCAVLAVVFLLLMLVVGYLHHLNGYYYLGLVAAAACFVFQFSVVRRRERDSYFAAFLNNQWVGVLVFLGILLSYL